MKIDDMPAGFNLDALVAQHIAKTRRVEYWSMDNNQALHVVGLVGGAWRIERNPSRSVDWCWKAHVAVSGHEGDGRGDTLAVAVIRAALHAAGVHETEEAEG